MNPTDRLYANMINAKDSFGIRVYWREADECWIARCNQMRGVSAFGDTPEEVLKEMGVALQNLLDSVKDDLEKPTDG